MLRWYPRGHRSEHEEEMLGVLLAAARPGQARPTLRDGSDLVRGGLQVRAARGTAAAAGTRWPDALAVVGVLIPLIMSLHAVRLGLWWRSRIWVEISLTQAYPDWSAWAIWPLVAVLALLGARRTATLTALAALIWWAAIVGDQYLRHDATAAVVAIWWPLLGLAAVAGLTIGPGPRHGVKVLRRSKTMLAAAAALLAAMAIAEVPPYGVLESDGFPMVRDWAVPVAIVAGVLALFSAVGRRFLVLLSAPAVSYLLLLHTTGGGPWSNHSVIHLLPIVPISIVVFITSALSLGPAERIVRHIRHGDQ